MRLRQIFSAKINKCFHTNIYAMRRVPDLVVRCSIEVLKTCMRSKIFDVLQKIDKVPKSVRECGMNSCMRRYAHTNRNYHTCTKIYAVYRN